MRVGDISDLIVERYDPEAAVILYEGDCMDLLRTIPNDSVQLLVTSPPYNLGKTYERKLSLETYLQEQAAVIAECVRVLSPRGSLCWQVGNYVDKGTIVPLDAALYPTFQRLGLQLRNRIVWHFEHGLHCKNRFSGRYETVNWFTKSDDYRFHLDPVRVPQKYPGKKHFKGPKAGQYSGNPLGKNPGDVWTIPNVKSNHVEKTEHPCQFPLNWSSDSFCRSPTKAIWCWIRSLGSVQHDRCFTPPSKSGRRRDRAGVCSAYAQAIGRAGKRTLKDKADGTTGLRPCSGRQRTHQTAMER